MQEQTEVKEKKKMGLTSMIFAGLISGLILGVVLNLWVPHSYIRDDILVDGIFYVAGNGFIRLMKMLVVPLVFCSLVCGSSAIGDTKSLGKVGGRTIVFYLATTALAVTVAITVATIIKPGTGLDMSAIEAGEASAAESVSVTDTILNIIPENPIGALADGTMLQIILFALLVGVLLAIFQAVTQIHEQTLSFLFKVVVIAAVLLIGGGWMMETLLDYARSLFALMLQN